MSTLTVLCIEDNEANMLVIQRIMESQSMKLIPAFTAEEGIELARKYRPNLILMDLNLPGMDGLTATQILKRDIALQEIPIIAVTASSAITAQTCFDAGCEDHILKPVTLSKILVLFQKHGVF
jgi:CheY-like chemotaxis protein